MTASRVGVAIGYKRSEEWISEGWWNILSNSCETLFTGDLEGRYYYVHAIDYDRGGEWAGNATMCTAEKSFRINGVLDCGSKNYQEAGFFEIDTGEAKDYTIWLTDPSTNEAKTQ